MFSEAQKSAYRAVTAPESLRERVLDMATDMPQKKKPAGRWLTTAVAACLVLVMSSALLPKGGTEILVGGTAVGDAPVAVDGNSGVALARAVETLRVPLTVKTKKEMTLTPEDGVLRSAEALIAVNAVIDSREELFWEIENPDTAETYVLHVDSGDGSSALTLAFDAAENCWTVFAAQE